MDYDCYDDDLYVSEPEMEVQNTSILDRETTEEPDSEDYEEIDPTQEFPLAGWDPSDPIFERRSSGLAGKNFVYIGRLNPDERDSIRSLVYRDGENWV